MPTRTPKRALAAVFAAVTLVTSVFAVPGVCAEPPADVVVGFVDRPEPGYYSRTVMPTLAAMARAMPDRTVTGVRLSPDDPIADLMRLRPDILVAPASVYMELELNYGGHAIATRKTRWADNPSASVGAAVVVRADNNKIRTLADLRGRRMASGGADAVDGWLALAYELKERRLRPEAYRAHTAFLNFPMPDVISAVLSGKVEAGVLSTCMLERAELAGLLKPGALRVVDEKTTQGFSCRHSTALYPDIVVAALPRTAPDVVKATTLALLSMPENADFAWQVATNFVSVNRLYKELHLGPWKHLDDWSWRNLWKSYGTYALIIAICSALGFAGVISLTGCDRHLVRLLTKPLGKLGIFLLPACILVGFVVATAIPSMAGMSAAVGPTLIPLLVRAGFRPAMAAAAVASCVMAGYFNPGVSHNPFIAKLAGMEVMEFVGGYANVTFMVCGCLVVLMTGVCVAYGDFKKGGFEDAAQTEEEHQDEKVNVLCALAPLVPVALLLGFSFYIPSVKISVATAMLIGMMYAMLVTRADPQKTISKFFDGMGKGYGSILGIIIAAGVFASGLRATGVIDLFVNYLTHANEVAKIGGSVGPYVFGVLTGSGDAAAFAFNEAVTPHAAEFGMKIDGLGYLAMIAAGLGRMSSPLAGGLILLSGIAGVSPIEVVKRTAPAAIITLGILYFLV